MALVELKGIVKSFGEVAGGAEVLTGVDLEVQAGESVAIVGESGSGKSTILNIIGGLLPPTSGQVLFDGQDLATMSADELARFRNTCVGYVFQSHHLLPQCTALENVLVPTLVADAGTREGAEDRARALLDEVGLLNRLSHRPAQLSGGECQRVAVVRALVNEPSLLLADEPTGQLDAKSSDQLGDLLGNLNASRGVALLTVTHSERLAARMQRVLLLQDGKLAAMNPTP